MTDEYEPQVGDHVMITTRAIGDTVFGDIHDIDSYDGWYWVKLKSGGLYRATKSELKRVTGIK